MSYLFDVSTEELTGSAPITAAPFTISAWIRPVDATGNHRGVQIDDGTDANRFILAANGAAASDPIAATVVAATLANGANAIGYTANAWNHAAHVSTGVANRSAFANGGGKATNATSRTPTGLSTIRFGRQVAGGLSLVGYLAEVAVWDIALSDAEIASLAAGARPPSIQSGDLIAYWPLQANANDAIGSNHLSITGATLDAEHPYDTYERSSAVGATASVTAVGQRDLSRSAAIGATASITSVATFYSILERSSALSATAAISAAPQRDIQRSASLSATVMIASAPQRDLSRSAAIAAVAAIASSYSHDLVRSAAIAATADINATGAVQGQAVVHTRSASIGATASVTASPQRTLFRSAALTSTATIAAAAEFYSILSRSASLTALAGLTVSDYERTIQRAAAFEAAVGIVSQPQRTLFRSAQLGSTVQIAAGGSISRLVQRAAAFNAVAGIDASGRRFLATAEWMEGEIGLTGLGFDGIDLDSEIDLEPLTLSR